MVGISGAPIKDDDASIAEGERPIRERGDLQNPNEWVFYRQPNGISGLVSLWA